MTRKHERERRQEALYRYLVIAPLLPPQLDRKERARRLAQILRDPPRPRTEARRRRSRSGRSSAG